MRSSLPVLVTRSLAVAALVATSVVVAPVATAAPAATTALHQQRLLEDSTPPSDPMADVAGGTMVQADALAMDDVSGAETRSGVTSVPPDVNPNHPTAAGRFEDPSTVLRTPGTNAVLDPQRVVALRFGDTGQDTAMLSLAARFPAEGPSGATLDGGANGVPRVGNTYVFSPSLTGRQQGVFVAAPTTWSDAVGGPVTGELAPAAPGGTEPDVPHAVAQWAVVADPAGSGAVALVNRADGTCLDNFSTDAPDAPVGVYPCNFGSQQLWSIGPSPTADGFDLQSVFSGQFLTATSPTTYVQKPSDQGDDQAFRVDAVLEPQGVLPTVGVPQAADPSLPFALATGDLDRTVDATGHYRDESVVAWADSARTLHVGVVDYSANASHYLFTTTTVTTIGAPGYVGSVGVAVGDFDDNPAHQGRIAVTWQDGGGSIHASLLAYEDGASYDETGSGGFGGDRTLRTTTADVDVHGILGTTGNADAASLVSGFTRAAAGDFNDSGHDLLAVTWADDDGTGNATEVGNAHLGIVSFTSSGAKDRASTRPLTSNGLTARVYGNYVRQGIPVTAALLKVDPDDNYPLSRRQVVAGWVSQARAVFQSFDVGADTGTVPLTVPTYTDDVTDHTASPNGVDTTQPISLAAGGFAGPGSSTSIPTWGVAVAVPYTRPATQGFQEVSRWTINGNGFGPGYVIPVRNQTGTRTALTAYDADDASVRVGAPQLIIVRGLRSVQAIGGQPPVHADWLPGRGFVNVNRNGTDVLTFSDSTTQSLSSTYTTNVDGEIGTSDSVGLTGKETVGVPGLVSQSGEISDKLAFKLQNDKIVKDEHELKVNVSTQLGASTTDDDAVIVVTQDAYVFRYPILGGPLTTDDGSPATQANCPSGCYGYYQVTLPGPPPVIAKEDGSDDPDFYNPTWQPGNALSYPTTIQAQPSDLGTYLAPDGKGGYTEQPPFYNPNDYDVDRTGTTIGVKTDASTTTGNTQQTTTSWNLDNTTSGSVSASVGIPKVDDVSVTASASLSLNGGQTFGNTTIGTTANTVAQTFSLTAPALSDPQYRYSATAAFYYSLAGTGKVVYATQFPADSWWTRTYGQAPDPALNLPLDLSRVGAVTATNPGLQWNTQADALRLRGFSVIQQSGPAAGTPLAPTASASVGDAVTFSVPVTNESLTSSPEGTVDFYAVPYDSKSDATNGAVVHVGTSTLAPAAARGSQTVVSPAWTAVGAPGALTTSYRIVVVVNQANGGAGEIHTLSGTPCDVEVPDGNGKPQKAYQFDPMTGTYPTTGVSLPGGTGGATVGCGQNNEGYGELTVLGVGGPKGAAAATSPDVRPVGAAFRTPTGEVFDAAQRTPTLTAGTRNAGTITFAADAPARAGQIVDVYDGPPSQGVHVATTVVRGATVGRLAVADYAWTPTTAGAHTLYQVLRGDARVGSSWEQTVQVQVTPAPTVAPDPGPTGPTTPTGPTGPSGSANPPVVAQGNGPSRLGDTGVPFVGLTLLIGVTLMAAGTAVTAAARRRRRPV